MVKTVFKQILEKGVEIGSLSRAGFYFLESKPLFLIERSIRSHNLPSPEEILPQQVVEEEIKKLTKEDAKLFSNHNLPISLFDIENPIDHIKSAVKIYLDAVGVSYRKKYKKHKIFSEQARIIKSDFPKYYQRNFHNQTDGYLSKESAELYDHQVELVFRGLAGPMRRTLLNPMLKHGPFKNILEVGCGTGVSTRILSKVFPKSKITAYDLSPFYIEHAEINNSFPNVIYNQGACEKLDQESNGSYDAVASTFVFHELPHDVRIEVLKESARLLKDGGLIFINDSVQEHDRLEYKELLSLFPQNFHEPFYKNYVQNPLEKDLENCGFEVLSSTDHFFNKVICARKKINNGD